ncbi:MAG: hypothetical protein ACD_73C00792G0007 [uncultured bacterium]|nr:MAG: hypothetical protein ACD_73C00792G0007 [uncultured bacterium]
MKTMIKLIAVIIFVLAYSPIVKSEDNKTVNTTKQCIDENHLEVCLNAICTTAPCTADKKCINDSRLLNGSQCLEKHNTVLSANSQRINEWRPFVSQAN